jgi:DNA-binding FadR family transcriptional regulator
MPLQAVETQRLYRQIADQLRDLMAAGEFKIGTRLPAERDLALQLGVSRPSVREALIADTGHAQRPEENAGRGRRR